MHADPGLVGSFSTSIALLPIVRDIPLTRSRTEFWHQNLPARRASTLVQTAGASIMADDGLFALLMAAERITGFATAFG